MVKHILRITLSCLLLVYVGLKTDWRIMAEVFSRIHIGWYLFSTGVALCSAGFIAGKYRLLVRNTPLDLPVRRLLVIQYISRFYALLLPTALGPEAVRWYKVTKDRQGKSFFLAATAYERILFLLTLIGTGLIPLLLVRQHPEIIALRERIAPVAAVACALLLAAWIYLFYGKIQETVNRFMKNRLRIRESNRLSQLIDNLAIKDRSLKLLILLVLATLGWQLFFVIRIFLLFQAMGLSFGFFEAAWMGSLVMLLQVLPVSFAGLGIREGAYAYLFSLYSLPPEQGFVIGLLFFTQMLVFAVIGAILNLFEK